MKSKIETILFMSAKPVSFNKMAEILAVEKDAVLKVVSELQIEYNKEGRGFRIVMDQKEAEMASAPENKKIAEALQKGEIQEELSRAALEVLAVILYKGPISKLQIEEIRGVNCSYTLRNLLMRGLIEKGGKDAVYRASLDLLKKLGVENAGKLSDRSV